MAYETIRLEVEEALAVLTLDRPKALNALNSQTLEEIDLALNEIAHNHAVRALIVTGGGEKAFAAGADIAEMNGYSPEKAGHLSGLGHRVFHRMESLSIPTIAAVNGFALGGGFELALSCDLLYASEKAKFGLPEVGLGVIPGFGGTQRLTRLVGRGRAKAMIFTGDTLDARRALEVGIVLEVLAPDQLMAHCRAVAATIAKKGPLAIAQAKRVIESGADVDLRKGNELEQQAFAQLFGTDDLREGMAAFLGKRPPVFQGR